MPEIDVLERPPRVFQPLDAPDLRYLGAHGGRGSGKSHNFAGKAVRFASEPCHTGARILCAREVQKSLKESAKKLVEDKIRQFQAPGFRILEHEIKTPGGGLIAFQGLAEHTAESIMSYEGFDILWVEQAETLSQRSLDIVRPTLRKPGSQLWFSWNPRKRTDPVDALFRSGQPPPRSACVRANWRNNPYLTRELIEEREYDQLHNPDTYENKWEGEYATIIKGAYYADALSQAEKEGRICRLAPDPLLKIRSFHDIGGAGASSDAYSIWVAQFVGRDIYVLDHYAAEGQALAYHASWMRERGYEGAVVQLPHDGVAANNVTGKRYADHWKDAGFVVPDPIPNQGQGAAMMRVQAARRLFPRIWFDAEKTKAGRESLAWYHAKRDPDRNIDLGPEHDWASHDADAFGLMAVAYQDPKPIAQRASTPQVWEIASDRAQPSTEWMRA